MERIEKAEKLVEMINARNFGGCTGTVWAKGDKVRVYIRCNVGGEVRHYIEIDANGVAMLVKGKGTRGVADMMAEVINQLAAAEQAAAESEKTAEVAEAANISIDNGNTYMTAAKLTDEQVRGALDRVGMDTSAESEAAKYAAEGADTDREWLQRYADALGGLVIG